MKADRSSICFVGLDNYPVMNQDYSHHYFGGESVQQSLIAKALAARGREVSMLVKDYGQPRDHAISGVRCLSTFADGEGLPMLRFIYPKIYSIWRALHEADADICYQSCADMLTGVVAAFCKRRNKKFIYRVASDLDVEPDRLKIRLVRDKALYLWGLKNADRILPQTVYQNEKLMQNFERSGHITNMIVAVPDGKVEERVDVLWVNNIRPLKRAEKILDIAQALRELQFVVIGGPVPGCEAHYEEIVGKLDALENVTVKGMLPVAETAKYFNCCKVFLNTSDIEGFPNAFLQAWSAGKPIVSIFDPDNLIDKAELGVAVKADDEFPQAIAKLINDDVLYQRLSKNAAKYIAENHSDRIVVDSIIEVIEGLYG